MSKNSYIFLNSQDGVGTNYDINFNLNISPVQNNIQNIALVNCSFNNAVYPINNFNRTFVIVEQGPTTLTMTIPTNTYTGTEMATQLQTLLNAATVAPYVYTVSYNSQSKKLTISSTGTFYISSLGTCLDELGMIASGTTLVATKTSDYPVSLAGSKFVDIISSISSTNLSSNGYSNILCRIPLASSFGGLIIWESFDVSAGIHIQGEVSNIQLRLIDDKGRPFMLPQNSYSSFTFRLD